MDLNAHTSKPTRLRETSPECPRCGYDLRGAMEAWPARSAPEGQSGADGPRCPIGDTCPECGYTFLWRDLLNPEYQDLPGFYEHARTMGERVRWGIRTTLWLLFPWVFWGKLKLHHRRKPWRALRLGLWLIGISVVIRLASAGIGYGIDPSTFRSPWDLRGPGVRLEQNLFNAAFGDAMKWNLHWVPDTHARSTRVDVLFIQRPVDGLIWLAIVVAFSTAMGALVVWALPHTRRVARLRPSHAWRAVPYVLYAVAIVTMAHALFACAVLASDAAQRLGLSRRGLLARNVLLRVQFREWVTILSFLWLLCFWWSAILRGWRIRHGWSVCILFTIGAGVLATIIAAVVFLALWQTGRSWTFTF